MTGVAADGAVRSDDGTGGPDERTAVRLVAMMSSAGLTLAVAESLTGGGLSARVVDVPGASAVLRGGVVAYATDLKAQLLGVDQALLSREGPVDPDVALAMASGVRRLLGADVGISTTGVAGPGPQDGRTPGTVYVAVDDGGGRPQVRRLALHGTRDAVRAQTVTAALGLLAEVVGQPERS